VTRLDPRYAAFPEGFFDRGDEEPDDRFYAQPRLVTHIDDDAIAEVEQLYTELGVADGDVLDLMSSWVSHLPRRPRRLVVLGMNARELERNPYAHEVVVADLNAEPRLPFDDASFDTVTCCVSVDYLTSPLEVFDEVARVLRPGGRFVCTFSNRCFPTKAIRGWLASDDSGHVVLVTEYFRRSGRPEPAWEEPVVQHRNPDAYSDPLYAVWARRRRPAD
jgi:SAM-dependent methyltransferase